MTQPNPQPLPHPAPRPNNASPYGSAAPVPQHAGAPMRRPMPQTAPMQPMHPSAPPYPQQNGYAPIQPQAMPVHMPAPGAGSHYPQGQPPMGQPPMGQSPMGHAPMGQPPMGQNQAYAGALIAQPHALPSAAIPQAAPHMNAYEPSPMEGGEKALPQISIHAFCDRTETAGTINESTRDWRMKRTTVKIYMGGLLAAIEFYRKESTPNLIMVETGLRGGELFNQLEQLASVCDPGTNVVIIGAANDIKLYRELMDKGVSDYLVPPFHPLALIRSLGNLYNDPDKPFVGRTTAFFAAKGGAGSSTLSHNIAWCLSEHLSQDTALVDLDSSWGTTGLDFAYDASQGLEEALSEPDRLDETLLDRIMLRHTPKLSILPTSGSLISGAPASADAYEAVVNAVRGMSPHSILDLPHTWTDWTIKILTSSDDVVITASPDLANLRNTKNLIDFFHEVRPNDQPPILILNKVGMTKSNEISVKDFTAAVGQDPALVIGFDPDCFMEAANDGKMLSDVKGAGQTVSGLNYIANRLKTGTFSNNGASPKSGNKGLSLKKISSMDTGGVGSFLSKLKSKR